MNEYPNNKQSGLIVSLIVIIMLLTAALIAVFVLNPRSNSVQEPTINPPINDQPEPEMVILPDRAEPIQQLALNVLNLNYLTNTEYEGGLDMTATDLYALSDSATNTNMACVDYERGIGEMPSIEEMASFYAGLAGAAAEGLHQQLMTEISENGYRLVRTCEHATGSYALAVGDYRAHALYRIAPQENNNVMLQEFGPFTGIVDGVYGFYDVDGMPVVFRGYGDAGIVSWQAFAVDPSVGQLEMIESCLFESAIVTDDEVPTLSCAREYVKR